MNLLVKAKCVLVTMPALMALSDDLICLGMSGICLVALHSDEIYYPRICSSAIEFQLFACKGLFLSCICVLV